MSRARQYARAYRAPVQQRYRIGDVVIMNNGTYNNFLACNGAVLNIQDYPDLYNVLQNNYSINTQPGNGRPWEQQYKYNNQQIGDITGWVNNSTLPDNINENVAVVTKNRVYCIGGRNNSGVVNTIYSAPINSDGTLGSWSLLGNTPNNYSFRQVIVVNNYLYLIGGYNDSTIAVSDVSYTTINSDGSLSNWSTGVPLPTPLARSNAFLTSNKIHVVSGTNFYNSYSNLSYIGNINSSGFITSWTTGRPFPINVFRGAVAVTDRYVYYIGGLVIGDAINSVYRAYIYNDGTISDWLQDMNLPIPIARAACVVTKNKIYIIGGTTTNNTQSNAVYYASLNSDGTINNWSSGTTLPVTISQHQLVVTNSRIYSIGGVINGVYSGSLYSAPFSGGLNDYSPYYTSLYTDPNVSASQFRLPDMTTVKKPLNTSYFIKVK